MNKEDTQTTTKRRTGTKKEKQRQRISNKDTHERTKRSYRDLTSHKKGDRRVL